MQYHPSASIPGPLASIADNPEFSPGSQNKGIPTTNKGSPLLASHCVQAVVVEFRESLQTLCNDPALPQWTYLQLHSFLSKHKCKLSSKAPTQLETICLNAMMTKRATLYTSSQVLH